MMFGRSIDEVMQQGETREGKEEDERKAGDEGSSEEEQGEGEEEGTDAEENFLEVDPEVEEIMEELTAL